MKKIFICLSMILLSFSIDAQRLLRGGINIGFDVPLHQKEFSSNFAVSRSINYEFGAFVRIGKTFYAQAGIIYAINKFQIRNLFIDSSSAIEIGQINLPILFVYGYDFSTKKMLRINAGIQYRGVVRFTDNKIQFNKSHINTHNMDIIVGLGFDISNFSFDIAYRKSIKPLGAQKGSKYYQDMLAFSFGVII